MCTFAYFLTAIAKVSFLGGRLCTRLSPPEFEIFLTFPHFLRSTVLSCLATREATRITSLLIPDIIFCFTCGKFGPISIIFGGH